MSDQVMIVLDGQRRTLPAGVTLAAALLSVGHVAFRRDASGAPRAPLCGMGTCFECRVTIDGVTDSRACLVSIEEGMVVDTGR